MRRATTLIIVLLLHAALFLALLLTHEVTQTLRERDPIIVTLLPVDKPGAPEPKTEPLPQPDPAKAAPKSQAQATPPPVPAPDQKPKPVTAPAHAAASASPDITLSGGNSGGGARSVGEVPARWVHKITDDEFFPLMDEDLWHVPMDVTFRLSCLVGADTRIDCHILSEKPTIPGVRRAVLRGLPFLRMRPPLRDGKPLVDVPVEFEWRVGIHAGLSALDR